MPLKKTRDKPRWQIPVGQHRLQCDVQELPAIQGSKGFEYKISFIHLRTRWKYSEIHHNQQSATIAGVYQRALDNLPPFFITFTDNAMSFTMKYTAHPERQTAFTKAIEKDGRIHALIKKASPWRNGIIERSNRTDNEECFQQIRFTCSEDRRYQHRLWEMQYNYRRPHQGLDNKTPFQVYKEHYKFHAGSRNL